MKPNHGPRKSLSYLAALLLTAALGTTGCATGSDSVAQSGSFDFVAPGGQTDIVYDPRSNEAPSANCPVPT